MTFTCPGCKESFEFDSIGEYELVPCPVCGIDFMTVRKNQALMLEAFEVNRETPKIENTTTLLVELQC